MKEFIEKLIGRLEELKELHAELIKDGLEEDFHSGCEGMCVDIIESVNQLAEEYKNKAVKGDLISRSELKEDLKTISVKIDLDEVNKIKDDTQFVEAIIHNCTEILLKHIDKQPTAYNDGWIPCSERLPSEKGKYLVTIKNLTGFWILENVVFVCDYAYDTFIFQGWEDNEVIAWQPLPEPYQPKGE